MKNIANYICRIATLEEMEQKWDYEIAHADNKENWLIWKEENLTSKKLNQVIPYYGILNDLIICEATTIIDAKLLKNSFGLINQKTAYLSAFRTIPAYQNQGYFSHLFKYMIEDLKNRGYRYVTIGVEPNEIKNQNIYAKWGFTEFIKKGIETYPDNKVIEVLYYKKEL